MHRSYGRDEERALAIAHDQWRRRSSPSTVDGVYLHHVGQEQDGFIEAFGENVLPKLRG